MKIKQLYTKDFPTDEMGKDINPNATFIGLIGVLHNRKDVYDYIGVDDSLVRERVFDMLSKLMDVPYDRIYDMWLKSEN